MNRRARLPLYFLLACALFVRLSIPAGWMPATGAGLFAIEPCVAAAPVAMPKHDMAHHHQHKQQHDSECSFAPLAAAAAPAHLAPTLLPPVAAEATLHTSLAAPFFATGPPSPPPPATGPPAIA